jgi:hypothetical protein
VYPLTRALYGLQVRQPIGGEFGVSPGVIDCYLRKDVWGTEVARFGIDIWMTTVAIAEGFRVCQSFLGAKLHDAKDPGADLSAMLQQVVSSVFDLMLEYESVWRKRTDSIPAPLFGFRFDVGLEPIQVDVTRMLNTFQRSGQELGEIWKIALQPATLNKIRSLASVGPGQGRSFHMDDELWAKVVFEFSYAYSRNRLVRGQLLQSLTPLYLGRVASFVLETEKLVSHEVEERIEQLCTSYERLKPYLIALWQGEPGLESYAREQAEAGEKKRNADLEVRNV